MSAPTVAICVGTCGRERLLLGLLQSLGELWVPDGWTAELRLVDNRPERPVSEAAQAAARAFPGSVHLLVEPARNVAAVRNRAVDLGPADLVAFVDDDEQVEPGWLEELWAALERQEADAVVGPVRRRLPAGAPGWLRAAARDATPAREGPLDWRQARTGNALIRGGWFYQRGFRFDEAFGRSGGEDTDLFGRLERAGARLGSAPRAIVQESWEGERLTLAWNCRRRWHSAITYHRLASRLEPGYGPGPATLRRAARVAGGVALGLATGVLPWGRRRLGLAALDAAALAGGVQAWLAPPREYAPYGAEEEPCESRS